MKVKALSPLRAFLLVLLGVLAYHFTFAVGGLYVTTPGTLPPAAGHLLLVWVPMVGSIAFFVWATRGASSSLLRLTVQTVVAASVSMVISLSAMYYLVVLLRGE